MITTGYVGTIEVETEGTDRIWFSLTQQDNGSNWVKVDEKRAWFQMNVEPSNARWVEMAKFALILDAMQEGCQVAVNHPDLPHDGINRMVPDDTYDAVKVRVLRAGLYF